MFDFSQPHKLVNGDPVALTSSEIAEAEGRRVEWDANSSARAKERLLSKIAAIEAGTSMPRALRDLVLSDPNCAAYAKTKETEDAIALIREEIKSLDLG